jgi:hypothetical protein
MRNTSGNIASLSITLFLAAGTFPAPSRHLLGRSDHSLRTRFDPLLSRTPDRQATNRSGGRPHEFQDQEPCSPLALRPLLRLPWNSAQNSPGDEEAGEEDEGQEGGKPPLVPNGPPSEPPFPPPEEPRHTASSLPIGLPTPERPLSPSGSLPPPRIPRNARPNPPPPQPLPNRLRIIRRIRIHHLRPRPCPPPPPPLHPQAPPRLLQPTAVVFIPRPHHDTQWDVACTGDFRAVNVTVREPCLTVSARSCSPAEC